MAWPRPSERQRAAWANTTDAIEAGAYALALAALEKAVGLFAVQRADTLTGADYYVAPEGGAFSQTYRFEISGVGAGDETTVRRRFREKISQARAGRSNLAALACVVGFSTRTIIIGAVEWP